MTDGVHYQRIITAASDDQLCALAPISLRPMINELRQGAGKMPDEQKRKIFEECVDFSIVANDDESLKSFVEILSHKNFSNQSISGG